MTEKKNDRMMTPVGRLVNASLWVKDTYKDEKGREATPQYKIEMAFEPKDINDLEDAVVAAAIEEWGAGAEKDYDNGTIRSPIIDGDQLADERVKRGKAGDAYKGKVVLRANTQFNRHGEDGPGGIYVCDEKAEAIDFANQSKVYPGSYGIAVINISPYSVDRQRGVKLYLAGYQFVKDGERLRSNDVAGIFKPMIGGGTGAPAAGRRARRA